MLGLGGAMADIREVDPFDGAAFAAWHAAMAEGALAGRTAATASSLEGMTQSLQDPSGLLLRVAVGAFDGKQCVGTLLYELPLKDDLDSVMTEINVPTAYRRRGLGTALWAWASGQAQADGRTIVQVEVNVPRGETTRTWPGAVFAEKLGFAVGHVEDRLIADLPFDADLLVDLEASLADVTGYRTVSWADTCPAEYLQSYADLNTEMSRDVPTGTVTRDVVVHDPERIRTRENRMARSWTTLVSLALAKDGTPVGYTDLYLPRTTPEVVMQDDTLVLRAHRGHRLGTMLKVANLRQLESLPAEDVARRRILQTFTAQDNVPMQKVNARFGFRPVETMYEYEKSG